MNTSIPDSFGEPKPIYIHPSNQWPPLSWFLLCTRIHRVKAHSSCLSPVLELPILPSVLLYHPPHVPSPRSELFPARWNTPTNCLSTPSPTPLSHPYPSRSKTSSLLVSPRSHYKGNRTLSVAR